MSFRLFRWLATRGVKRQLTAEDEEFLYTMYDMLPHRRWFRCSKVKKD